MSLIVAEVSNDFGWMVGDTLLTGIPDETLETVNGDFHALKIHLLNDKVCIALAGKYDLALDVVNEIALILDKNPILDKNLIDKVNEIYLDHSMRDGYNLNACEFLVMLILENESILAKISNGELNFCQRGYIGDSLVYKELQNKRTPYNAPKIRSVQQPDGSFIEEPYVCPEVEKNFMEVSDAMEKVSGKAISSTVGVIANNVIRVGINRQNIFEYFQHGSRGVSAEEGEHGGTLLSSVSPKHGIGIYYFTGLGFLFVSGDKTGCKKVYAKTLNEFIGIGKMHSLELTGATW